MPAVCDCRDGLWRVPYQLAASFGGRVTEFADSQLVTYIRGNEIAFRINRL